MELFEQIHGKRDKVGPIMWFAVWLTITGFGIYLTPSASGHGTHEELGLPPCPSVLLFDRPCPGCGLTTSWTAFIHGDWAAAFHAHPLGPFLYVGFTLYAVGGFLLLFRGRMFDAHSRWANKAMTALLVVFLVFGIGRMILSPGFGTPQERLVAHAIKA